MSHHQQEPRSRGRIAGSFACLLLSITAGAAHADEVGKSQAQHHCAGGVTGADGQKAGIAEQMDTARQIAQAVVREHYGAAKAEEIRTIELADRGDSWRASVVWKPHIYDGEMEFSISKCNGAIRDIRFDG